MTAPTERVMIKFRRDKDGRRVSIAPPEGGWEKKDNEEVLLCDLIIKKPNPAPKPAPKTATKIVATKAIATEISLEKTGDATLYVRSKRGVNGVVSCCGSANKNELRAWCRKKYGKDWWKDKELKKERLAKARKKINKIVISDIVEEE